jgi:hypothetical protein
VFDLACHCNRSHNGSIYWQVKPIKFKFFLVLNEIGDLECQ